MVDGVLYSRTNTEKDFSPVALDAKFAEYNLNSLDSSIKRKN